MKLYTGDLSPYSAKIRMQIYAMGIDDITFELPTAFFMGKMSELSPVGRIPVLEADGVIIPESEVIAEYLDDIYPEQSMLGATPKIRAQVRLLSRIADVYLMNNIFMSLSQLMAESRNEAIIELLIKQVERGVVALEKHIDSGPFAVGDTLSRADCTLVPALFMCEKTVPRLGRENPLLATTQVAAYWQAIQQNPHAARVIEEMNKGLKERLDGTERKRVQAAIAAFKATAES
jgi:glutathione S-transferase